MVQLWLKNLGIAGNFIDTYLGKYEIFSKIFSQGVNAALVRVEVYSTACQLWYKNKKKKEVDYGSVFGALLIDWPKAFNCISHDLIIGKVEAYGFQTDADPSSTIGCHTYF